MSKAIDIAGKKFGKLTAIHPVGRDAQGNVLWFCSCECGETTKTTSARLRNGITKSCGCMNHVVNDLTGHTFGKLTVLCRVPPKEDTKKRTAWWLCRCECGRETVVDSNSLQTRNTQSCGDCSWGKYEFYPNYVIGTFVDNTSFMISYEDYPRVRKHRWWVDTGSGYFGTNINGRIMLLHNFLMNPPEGKICDHINRNKMDNRRSNLRYATQKENSRNRSKLSVNTSGYIGVSWHIRKRKYVAQIKIDGHTIHLGSFDNAEDAARVRDKAALFYFGEFANLNFGGRHHEIENTQAG